jgi:hypothetical protein
MQIKKLNRFNHKKFIHQTLFVLMKATLVVLFLIGLITNNLFSQDSNNLEKKSKLFVNYYGVEVSSNLNVHRADFQGLPNVATCCDNFESGIGLGFSFGLAYVYKIPTWNVIFESKLGFTSLNADVSKYIFQSIENVSNKAKIDNVIEAYLSSTEFNQGIRLPDLFGLQLSSGLSLNYIYSAEFKQYEKLIEPSDRGTFENKKRIRNDTSGTIENSNHLLFGIYASLDYSFDISKNGQYKFRPFVKATYYFNSILREDLWSMSSLRLGFMFTYQDIQEENNPIEPVPNIGN